jgi:hypothetical protein
MVLIFKTCGIVGVTNKKGAWITKPKIVMFSFHCALFVHLTREKRG